MQIIFTIKFCCRCEYKSQQIGQLERAMGKTSSVSLKHQTIFAK